ncbi:hypothetical protein Nepgr_018115 [Nepenthes gracilis]|uniref:Uncharacterized protein n=1 Tax=Nepenthes gracilis TaxID=150966 RepID=A0AAD3XTR0_NEPGR|nr:hypothetical protein Nepgr_018115 [Nepenthes gracilis]
MLKPGRKRTDGNVNNHESFKEAVAHRIWLRYWCLSGGDCKIESDTETQWCKETQRKCSSTLFRCGQTAHDSAYQSAASHQEPAALI